MCPHGDGVFSISDVESVQMMDWELHDHVGAHEKKQSALEKG